MKKIKKIIVVLFAFLAIIVIVSYIIFPGLWPYYLPFLREETARSVSSEFAVALRVNDPVAYELSDPSLWPRLDQWMETHEVQECEKIPDEQFSGGGATVLFYCITLSGEYHFDVLDIIIEKREDSFLVIDWGEIIEEFSN